MAVIWSSGERLKKEFDPNTEPKLMREILR